MKKRLQEFEQVPSADLTPAEFEAIDFEHFEESDPPAYTRGRLAIEEVCFIIIFHLQSFPPLTSHYRRRICKSLPLNK